MTSAMREERPAMPMEDPAGGLPRLETMTCQDPGGSHRFAYALWPGDADGGKPPVIAVHGLTRNGRDFDALAQALGPSRAVFCPDIVGRGRSGWLERPGDYGYPVYLADCDALLAQLRAHVLRTGVGAAAVDWVGTSMGGLIGLMLASRPHSPIRRLVLNDIGPFIPKAALQRIGSYVGRSPPLPDLTAVEAELRRVHGSFGPLSDAEWGHLARHSARPLPEGGFGLAYDPAIGDAFRGELADVDLWAIYDQIRCPTLVLRGARSDVLPAETARDMTTRGPRAQLVEFAGVGHAPALMAPGQIAAIRGFLDG